jgi:putative nucleotidyltransferase with HDIG domain
MGLVYLDDVKAGMRLEQDLLCPNGRFLLSKGAIIEDKHIKIARSWGITEAYIDGADKDSLDSAAEAEFSEKTLENAEKILEEQYTRVDRSVDVVDEIYRLNKLKTASEIESGKIDVDAALNKKDISKYDVPNVNINAITAKSVVDREVGLASFPDIYYKINEVLNSPKSSASHMAEVVEKDTSLSAKLLKIVNSAFYSFPSKIDSIRRAITIIGTKELATLAVGISAIEAFKGIPVELTNMRVFWRHSIACGVFARLLGTYIENVSTERLFVSGLLHDIGRLVIFRSMPEYSAYTLYLSERDLKPLSEIEEEVYGFDHAEVGSLLMEKWKFPEKLIRNIKFHHAAKPVTIESSIVNVADCMAVAFGAPVSRSTIVPPIHREIWDSLELSPSVIQPILNQSSRQIEEIEDVFFAVM